MRFADGRMREMSRKLLTRKVVRVDAVRLTGLGYTRPPQAMLENNE